MMNRFVMCLYLALPLLANSQIHVDKKEIIIAKIKGGVNGATIEQDSSQGVVIYNFVFQNNRFTEITDLKLLPLESIDKLKEFGDAFKAAQKTDPGDRVAVKDYFIVKSKDLGFTGYTLFYDNGYCELSSKMAQKIIDAIDKYCSSKGLAITK